MLPDQIYTFFAISLLFIVTPGPNILIIVATSIAAGRVRGLQTVAGTASAMAIQLMIAAVATSSLLALLNEGLVWLKWLGVAYLMFLGIKALYRCWRPSSLNQISAKGSYQRGFLVSLTNPKTIFFFSAFLPQFVSSADYYVSQIAILSACFWTLAVVCDACYALLSAKLHWLIAANKQRATRVQNGLSGTLYLAAGAFLAGTNKI